MKQILDTNYMITKDGKVWVTQSENMIHSHTY